MIRRLKHHFPEKWEWILLLAALAILVAIISVTDKPVMPTNKDIDAMQDAKRCLERMTLNKDLQTCAAAVGEEEQKIKDTANLVIDTSYDYAERGSAFIVLKEFEKARDSLEKAWMENPFDAGVLKDLAFAHMNLYESKKVAKYCDLALNITPDDIDCLTMAGIAYYEMENNTLAVEYMKKADNLESHVCRQFNLGMMYGGIGELEKAKETIDNVITESKDILLRCWSPVMIIPPPPDVNRYNICFYSKNKAESVCRPFAFRNWTIKPTEM